MNEFQKFHPAVNFLYFMFVFVLAMWFINPISICITFFSGIAYLVILKRKKAIKNVVALALPTIITATVINAAFNHEGMNILSYLPDGNPLTYESLVYGFWSAVMISGVFLYFSCFNEIMTGDKFIYLFGKITPSLSLILSMTLKFVPGFIAHFKEVIRFKNSSAQKGTFKKLRHAFKVLSATATWALENSIDTSDSMKSRGFGAKKRTAFTVFKFAKRDFITLITILCLGTYIIFGKMIGVLDYVYFPVIIPGEITLFSISIYAAHFLLCILPVIIEATEVIKWEVSKSRI